LTIFISDWDAVLRVGDDVAVPVGLGKMKNS
jgi:hypothetical protein